MRQGLPELTPREFIEKWKASRLTERSAAQSYFNDLCKMLSKPTPTDSDPEGTWFTFEKVASKTGGGKGWSDVWKRGCFAIEFKGMHYARSTRKVGNRGTYSGKGEPHVRICNVAQSG